MLMEVFLRSQREVLLRRLCLRLSIWLATIMTISTRMLRDRKTTMMMISGELLSQVYLIMMVDDLNQATSFVKTSLSK